MQERLVCKALLLNKLVLKVLLIAAVIIVTILAVFLFSLASLVILASIFTFFVFCKVYRKVNRQLSTCKVTYRKELRACSLALFICVAGRLASFLLAYKALLLLTWLESTPIISALLASLICASSSASASGSAITIVAAVYIVLILCDHLSGVSSCEVCFNCRT